MTPAALIALNRFGLGADLGAGLGAGPSSQSAEAARDPRGWLRRQLAHQPTPAAFAGLPAGGVSVPQLAAKDKTAAAVAKEAEKMLREEARALYAREMTARLAMQIAGPAPLLERLIAFWSNHFTVSIQRPALIGMVGAFEREAIRPHVTGRFVDLMLAAESHPAMLFYLDNYQSIGPNSPAGRRSKRGLNENLAREILELHSLGVDGGYGQDDVRALACILTGWSIARGDDPSPGQFMFRPQTQEPGGQTLLGATYDGAGKRRAESALAALARHPRTIKRLCAKLAAHFSQDDPPPTLVARLAQVWTQTDGDMSAVYAALIDSPEAWEPTPRKMKSPHDFAISVWRLLGDDSPAKSRLESLALLGQTSFAAPSPAGWPDREADWLGPEALVQRIEWTHHMAEKVAPRVDPAQLLDAAFGESAPIALKQAVSRAPSAADAVTLILVSPFFMRR